MKLPTRMRLAANAFGFARWSEKPRVLWVMGLYLTRRLPVLREITPAQAWIKLGGASFRIAPGQGEMDGFTLAWIERRYEPRPGFIAKPGDVVVDGGANVGFYTTRQALRGARVVAFEPNPVTFTRLRASLTRNHLDQNVTAIPAALSDRHERRKFFVSGADTIGGTLFANGDSGRASSEVEVVTIDETIAKLGLERVDLVKLDVEGAELDALTGASRSLEQARAVVLEYHSPELRENCRTLLESSGFKMVMDDGHHLAVERSAV